MGHVVHRMTHLFKYKLNLDHDWIDLLLGRFAAWVHADYHRKNLTTEKTLYATSIIPPTNVIKHEAMLRVVSIWFLFKRYRLEMPSESMYSFYCGALMDTHMKILTHHDDDISLHKVYVLGIAPETTKLSSIFLSDNSSVSNAVMEEIWMTHMSDGAVQMATSKDRQPKRRGKKRKRGNNEQGLIVPGQILFDREQQKIPDYTKPQNPMAHRKIIAKGLPRPSSIRYIATALKRSILTEPEHHQAVVEIAILFILGAYKHAQIIAPPETRLEVYKKNNHKFLYGILSTFNARELHHIISEHIIGSTKRNPELYFMLEHDIDWKRYHSQSTQISDGIMRATMFNGSYDNLVIEKIKPSPLPERPLTPEKIFGALVKCIGPIKTSIPVDKLEHASKNISLDRVFDAIRSQPVENMRIHGEILRQIGMDPEHIEQLKNGLVSMTSGKIQREMNKLINSFSQETTSKLHIYIHYLLHRATFRIINVYEDRRNDLPRGPLPYILVCFNCYTIRSQARGSSAGRKSKEGVQLDIISQTNVSCSKCRSKKKIKCVPLVNRMVHGISVNDPSAPQLFTLCRLCGVITPYNKVVSDKQLCEPCYRKAQKTLLCKRCLCGVEFTSKSPVSSTITAVYKGNLTLVAFCDKHSWVIKHAENKKLPVEFYESLICHRQKNAGAAKSRGSRRYK